MSEVEDVTVQPSLLKSSFQAIPKAFMLHSSTLNLKQFKLEIPQPNLDSKQSVDDDHESFEIRISKLSPASNLSQQEMENMNIEMC